MQRRGGKYHQSKDAFLESSAACTAALPAWCMGATARSDRIARLPHSRPQPIGRSRRVGGASENWHRVKPQPKIGRELEARRHTPLPRTADKLYIGDWWLPRHVGEDKSISRISG
jgi:hypothetical protein